MRHAQLKDLLPPEALREVEALMKAGKCDADNLKPITRRYTADLLAKGVDADYLAYSIENAMNHVRGRR